LRGLAHLPGRLLSAALERAERAAVRLRSGRGARRHLKRERVFHLLLAVFNAARPSRKVRLVGRLADALRALVASRVFLGVVEQLARLGLGRVAAVCYRSAASYQIR
jgi:hypothetical protein